MGLRCCAGLYLAAVSRGCSLVVEYRLWAVGFSRGGPQELEDRLSRCSMGLSCCVTCAILLPWGSDL